MKLNKSIRPINKQYLLFFNNLIFIVLFFSINFFNRPAHDDFYSMFMVREMGVIDATIFQYHNWCTRFIGVFISFLVTAVPFSAKYFLFNTFIFLLFSFAILFFLKTLLEIPFDLSMLNKAIFIFSALFYSTINIGETWFWLSANSAYTLSFALLIIGISLIIKTKTKHYEYALIAILFLLIGGLNEILSTFIILSMLLMVLFYKKINLSKGQTIKLGVAILSVTTTLTILILGKGNAAREAFFNKISIFYSLILNIKMSGIILVKHILPKIPIMVLWAIILSNIQPLRKKLYTQNKHKLNIAIVSIALICIYVFQLPITYKTQDICALRALLPVSVLTFAIIYIVINSFSFFKKNVHIFMIFSIFIQMSFLIYQSGKGYRYANAYDNRMTYIEIEAKSREIDTIKVMALPESGWIKSSEITTNNKDFKNQHLKKGLNLKCEIIKKEADKNH